MRVITPGGRRRYGELLDRAGQSDSAKLPCVDDISEKLREPPHRPDPRRQKGSSSSTVDLLGTAPTELADPSTELTIIPRAFTLHHTANTTLDKQ